MKTPIGQFVQCGFAPILDSDFTGYGAIINVSATWFPTIHGKTLSQGVPCFWFPIIEHSGWGALPFVSATTIVQKYAGDLPILIHCVAGAARSPSVTYAVLTTFGYTDDEIDSHDPYLRKVFYRYLHSGHIPPETLSLMKDKFSAPTRGLDEIFPVKSIIKPIKSEI